MTQATLSDFVLRLDRHFNWHCIEQVQSESFPNVLVCQLEFTSQLWPEGEQAGINHPLWQHRLTLYLPQEKQTSKPCLLMVQGGYRHNPALETTPSAGVDGAYICSLTQAPVACLRDVPNQPQTISGIPRTEDDLVAWSWQQFLQSPDQHAFFLLQWPMVKAIVRAMDVIEGFCSFDIPSFIVAGASKRGWVTWLAATCDQRISAIIPIVIDVLNVQQCVRHHLKVYGGWADAIADYASPEHDILGDLESEGMQQLLKHVDPFQHLSSLSLPKIIINASCDEFFPPDSARFYYHQLPGFSALRYLPNASHYLGMDGSVNMTEVMTSCFAPLADQQRLPTMNWQSDDQSITLEVDQQPSSVYAWLCHNPEARDFRKTTPARSQYEYQPVPLEIEPNTHWRFHFQPEQPDSGWIAFFIEVHFANAPYPDLIYTSGIKVLPEDYP